MRKRRAAASPQWRAASPMACCISHRFVECSRLDAATESLLNAEKQCCLAGEVAGSRKSTVDIVEILFKDGACKTQSRPLQEEGPAQAGNPPSTSLLYAHLNFNSKLSLDGLRTRFDYLMILSYLVVYTSFVTYFFSGCYTRNLWNLLDLYLFFLDMNKKMLANQEQSKNVVRQYRPLTNLKGTQLLYFDQLVCRAMSIGAIISKLINYLAGAMG